MSVDLYEAMSTLRAVRRLRSDPLPEDVLGRVLQAAAWAPSGGNAQPWRVVVVRDADKRRGLGDLYRPQWAKYRVGAAQGVARLEGTAQAKQQRMLESIREEQEAKVFHDYGKRRAWPANRELQVNPTEVHVAEGTYPFGDMYLGRNGMKGGGKRPT